MNLKIFNTPPAIERLTFHVEPELLDRWVELDHEIWTTALAQCPGFADKELWINASKPGEVTAIIYWTSYEEWQALDPKWVSQIAADFDRAVGKDSYRLTCKVEDVDQLFLLAKCESPG